MKKFSRKKIAFALACTSILGVKIQAMDTNKAQTPQTVAAVGATSRNNQSKQGLSKNQKLGIIAAASLVVASVVVFTILGVKYLGKKESCSDPNKTPNIEKKKENSNSSENSLKDQEIKSDPNKSNNSLENSPQDKAKIREEVIKKVFDIIDYFKDCDMFQKSEKDKIIAKKEIEQKKKYLQIGEIKCCDCKKDEFIDEFFKFDFNYLLNILQRFREGNKTSVSFEDYNESKIEVVYNGEDYLLTLKNDELMVYARNLTGGKEYTVVFQSPGKN